MAHSVEGFLNPFRIHVDPMDRLLLVNFENDPDSTYMGFEPQGAGHLIIGWRTDGRVDVYHQAGMTLDPGSYDITGKGLANMVEVSMGEAFYEVDDHGVQAQYRFNDIHDRETVVRIHEKNPKKREPFDLRAPMGDAAETPASMPLISR